MNINLTTNRKELRKIMGQVEDLRAAVGQLGVDLGEAIARVDAKIAALGEPDPDLTADIAAIRNVSEQLDALQAEAPTDGDTGPPTDGGDTPAV